MVNDIMRSVIYLRTLIIYEKLQYTTSDLFTITDTVR